MARRAAHPGRARAPASASCSWCCSQSSRRCCGRSRPTPRTSPTCCRARPASTGQAPTTSAATSSTGCWSRPGSRSNSPCWPPLIAVVAGLLLGTAGVVLGRRADRFLTATVNIAVAFPGLLLALFFAVIFGVGAKGAVLAIGFAGAPGFARLAQTLVATRRRTRLHRRRAHRRRQPDAHPDCGTCCPTSPNRWSSTRPSAPAARCWPSPACPSSASACSRRATTGARCSATGLAGIYEQPVAALAPGIAVVLAGLAFNLFGESRRQGGRRSARRSAGYRPAAPSGSARPPPMPAGRPAHRRRRCRPRRRATSSSRSRAAGRRSGPSAASTFSIGRGEAVGVVGESGSGKSLTALAVARLIEEPGQVDASRLHFRGTDLRTGSRPHPPAAARHVVRDGVPGPDDLVQPDPPGRPPARRGQPAARRVVPQRRAGPRGRPVARGARAGGRAAGPSVPARVLRRHAAARDDRHGRHGHRRPSSSPTNRRPRST